MNITDVEVYVLSEKNIKIINETDMLVAYASLVFDNVLCCNSISVVWKTDKQKYHIKMPKHIIRKNRSRDTFFAINNEFRRVMESAILGKIRLQVPDPWSTWNSLYEELKEC